MLINSFCHIDGIGLKKETKLWEKGILNWEEALRADEFSEFCTQKEYQKFRNSLELSCRKYEEKSVDYFFNAIPRSQHWRFFREFRDDMAFLDIETTGLTKYDSITVISIYHRGKLGVYVKEINFDDFLKDIKKPRILVTFNGNKFDIPFIENYFGIKIYQNRIDLRFVLSNLGFGGGLKKCEKILGIEREGLEEIDGNIAVMLWNEYKYKRNIKALKTLIAYNVTDTVNLEKLAVIAYNENVRRTEGKFGYLEAPERKAPPFFPNKTLVRRIIKNIRN